MSLNISKTVKSTPPIDGVLFTKIKNKVLGSDYELSLVFIGKKRSQKINNQYRQKNYPTDILSFGLDKTSGEIFINPDKAKIKAKEFERTYKNYLSFLFIHGLMHLKGFDHGSRMESEEEKIRRIFKI